MLHQDLQDVIAEYAKSNWIVVIESPSIIHFYESMEALRDNGGEFVTVVRSNDGKVVYMSSNAKMYSGTIDEIKTYLEDHLV